MKDVMLEYGILFNCCTCLITNMDRKYIYDKLFACIIVFTYTLFIDVIQFSEDFQYFMKTASLV